MRLMSLLMIVLRGLAFPLRAVANVWLRFWRAVRFWHYLNYSWHLAWVKAWRSQ